MSAHIIACVTHLREQPRLSAGCAALPPSLPHIGPGDGEHLPHPDGHLPGPRLSVKVIQSPRLKQFSHPSSCSYPGSKVTDTHLSYCHTVIFNITLLISKDLQFLNVPNKVAI